MVEQGAQARQHVAYVVKQILINEARVNITPDHLSDDQTLNSELLRINSLSFLGVIISLEEALDIRLEDELFMKTKFATVGDLVDFIYPMCGDANQSRGASE
jgi:acyl carrier protein